MSVDYTRTPGADAPGSDSPMFAGTPIWERGRKRRGSARVRRVADDPVTGDTLGDTTAADAAIGASPLAAEEARRESAMSPNGDDAPFVAPRTRTTVRRERSVAPAAIGVGLVALAALAGIGWYATRPADTTMTPGSAPATAIATGPATPAAGGGAAELAANTPPSTAAQSAAMTPSTPATATPPAAASATTHHTASVTRTTRTRSTASPERSVTTPSATGAGVNTGATVSATTAPSSSTTTVGTSAGAAPSTPSTAAPPASASPPPVTSATPATPAPATTTPDVTAPSTATTTTPPAGSPQ